MRHTDPDDWYRINRRLRFGDLVDLWMLDERRFRTQPPAQPAVRLRISGIRGQRSRGDRMIGAEQEHWVLIGLAGSTAKWKVLGDQVPFFPQILLATVPGQVSALLGPKLSKARSRSRSLQLYVEDWNGFLKERQRIVDGMAAIKDVVVLTGDVHQSFASEIPRKPNTYLLDRKSVAVEFVTPGVASPSLQSIINQVAPGVGNLLDTVLNTNNLVANPWVKYAEGVETGCMVVDFDANRTQADWYLVRDALDPQSPIDYAASLDDQGRKWSTDEGQQPAGLTRASEVPQLLTKTRLVAGATGLLLAAVPTLVAAAPTEAERRRAAPSRPAIPTSA